MGIRNCSSLRICGNYTKTLVLTAKRKELHMQLPSKGDYNCEPLVRHQRNAIVRTYAAATLSARFTSRSASSSRKIIRQLTQGIKEHKSAWLKTERRKCITSAIVPHLADTRRQVNVEAFKVIHRAPGNSSKADPQLHLAAAESIAIRLLSR